MDIDLSKVVGYSKDSLKSRTLMRSIMQDLFPDKTREMNILLSVYESGVPKEIRNNGTITSEQYQQYVRRVIDNYGLQEKYACEGLDCWIDFCISPGTAAKLCGKKDSLCNNDFEYQVREEIKKKSVDNTPINDFASDYEVTLLSSGKLEIKKFIGFDKELIVVPNMIDGKEVIGIGVNAYKSCIGVERVVISEGIQYISDGAFAGCVRLKSISIPNSVSTIGNRDGRNGTFSNTSIENVDLPYGINYLGKCTFRECNLLKSINLPNSIIEIDDMCFSNCKSLERVKLPDKINIIGNAAFAQCYNINNLVLPTNTRIIGNGVFSNCNMLSNIRLNEGLIHIGDKAFSNCYTLAKITIPSTVTELGRNIFIIEKWYQPLNRRRKGYTTEYKNKNLIIYCYAGSKGLEYARKEGYQIENAAKLKS